MYEKTRLGQMILKHWLAHCPEMTEELSKNGRLVEAVHEAQERTGDLLYEMISVKKMDYQEAWEIATREWAFPPGEETRPLPSPADLTPPPSKNPPATSE